mmetsp:Transcript_6698/g.12147  ORF Transcript_6698/g.12147 Transcript_6698/m.12147 type:complete len:138 (+) Transcript_6698:676-1089(+)
MEASMMVNGQRTSSMALEHTLTQRVMSAQLSGRKGSQATSQPIIWRLQSAKLRARRGNASTKWCKSTPRLVRTRLHVEALHFRFDVDTICGSFHVTTENKLSTTSKAAPMQLRYVFKFAYMSQRHGRARGMVVPEAR